MAGSSNGVSKTEGRLSSLEANYAQLHTDLAGLRDGLSTFMSEIRSDIKEMRSTPWGNYLKGAGLLCGIIVSIGGLVAFGIDAKINHISDALNTHIEQPAHFDALSTLGRNSERMAHMETAITRLDEVLQREMRILDQEGAAKLDALDSRLQMEMRLLQQVRDQSIELIRKRSEKTEDWITEHDQVVAGLNAAQWERIRALERAVYGDKPDAGEGLKIPK